MLPDDILRTPKLSRFLSHFAMSPRIEINFVYNNGTQGIHGRGSTTYHLRHYFAYRAIRRTFYDTVIIKKISQQYVSSQFISNKLITRIRNCGTNSVLGFDIFHTSLYYLREYYSLKEEILDSHATVLWKSHSSQRRHAYIQLFRLLLLFMDAILIRQLKYWYHAMFKI